MKCIKCGGKTKIIDSRHNKPDEVRRRRECLKCGYRFSTYETVIKKKDDKDNGTDNVTDISKKKKSWMDSDNLSRLFNQKYNKKNKVMEG